MKLNKNDEAVIAALQPNKQLTLAEISEQTTLPGKKIFRSLRKLFEAEIINSNARKYGLVVSDPKEIKAKLAKKEEEPEA